MIFPVKPYIVGEGLQSMIIKKGQVISFDIKYGGEPEPEVKWMQGEEVITLLNTYLLKLLHKYNDTTELTDDNMN